MKCTENGRKHLPIIATNLTGESDDICCGEFAAAFCGGLCADNETRQNWTK